MNPMIEHRDRGWCDCITCTIPPPPKSETRRRALRRVRVRVLPVLTRGECAAWERPCVLTSCRYHLEHGGESCALDVADRGGATYSEIASLLGVTTNAAIYVERTALATLAKRAGRLRAEVDRGRSRPPEDRILAALADGPVEATDLLVQFEGVPLHALQSTLATMRDAGVLRHEGNRRGSVWMLAGEEES